MIFYWQIIDFDFSRIANVDRMRLSGLADQPIFAPSGDESRFTI